MTYLTYLLTSAFLCLMMYCFVSGSGSRAVKQWILSVILCPVFGVVLAKLVYYLAKINFMIATGWAANLIDTDPTTWSYYGGAAGVCLGIAAAAKLSGVKPMEALNGFAPWGALLAALARMCEMAHPRDLMIGFGAYITNESLCFFPLAVGNEWGEWYLSVFMIEALLSLIVYFISLLFFRQDRFVRTVFYLCLIQIFCESLRSDSISWLFVRVEQLLCLLGVLFILLRYGLKAENKKGRFVPVLAGIGCTLLFVALEFALDKTDIPHVITYAVMWLGMGVLAWMECLGHGKIAQNTVTAE